MKRTEEMTWTVGASPAPFSLSTTSSSFTRRGAGYQYLIRARRPRSQGISFPCPDGLPHPIFAEASSSNDTYGRHGLPGCRPELRFHRREEHLSFSLSLSSRDSSTSPAQAKEAEDDDKPQRLIPPIEWGGPEGKDFTLQFGGETRVRGESRHDFDGIMGTRESDTLGVVRTRFHAELLHRKVARAFLEVLDGRVLDGDYEYLQDTHFSLQQAFLEFPDIRETSWSLRLGRQEMQLGRDRRLVNASGWNNLRRTFQGVRGVYRTEGMDADLFFLNTVPFERRRNGRTVTERARLRDDEFFYGGYVTLRQWKPHTIEAFFLGLSDGDDGRTLSERGVAGSSDRFTVGSVFYGPLWKRKDHGILSYTMEGALQFGHRSTDRIRAWMLRGDVGYEWETHPWKPLLALEGNLASGDRERGDGVNNTFSPLFGGAHSPYGILDAVRLQNVRDLALVGRVNPTSRLRLQLELHGLWLDSKTDAWYDGREQSLGRDPAGRSGRRLGQEIDLIANYRWSKNLTLEGGAACFLPGTAARNFGKDGTARFFYLQTTFEF